MLDDLDLAFEEDRGRHRHRRRAQRGQSGRRRRRGRSLLALFLTLVILGGLGFGAWYGFGRIQSFFVAPDYNSGGTGEATVQVKQGDSVSDIATELFNKDVIKSTKAFIEAARANPRSTTIQPGVYKLRQRMRARDALAVLVDGSAKMTSRVVLPEGLTYKATFEALSKGTGIPVAEFEAAAKDPVALGIPDSWFARDDKKQSIESVEGFLFPATYEFDPGATASQILKQIVQQFMKVATELHVTDLAAQKGVTPFEVLITASLTQAEAGLVEDMPKVARVVYNRLNKPMNLEFDSTTNYWRELHGLERRHGLSDKELTDPSNPYRTYGLAGLPPGPIANPGKDALAAAIAPAPGTWIYFVRIDKSGRSAFTDDYNQHLRNIALAKQNGAL